MQFTIKKTITHVTVLSALPPTLPHPAAVSRTKHRQFGPRALAGAGTALVVAAMLSGCSSSTTRSSGGEDLVKSKQAQTAAAAPVEYEPAQYAEPPPAQPTPPVQQTAETAQAKAEEPQFAPEGDAPDMLPVPSPDSFAADADDDRIGEPVMFYDEDGGTAADELILGTTVFGGDDSGITPDDGIVSRQYYDDEGVAADDGIVSSQYYGDDGVADDGGIVARQVFDEEQAVADDGGIVASQVFDEEQAAADDGIVSRELYDDEGAVADDGIIGRQEFEDFTDEPEVVQDEPAGFPEFVDDTAEAQDEPFSPAFTDEAVAEEDIEPFAYAEESREPEETISEPTVFEGGEALAQVEEPAAQAVEEAKPMVLPLTISLDAEALFDFDRSLVRSDDRMKLDNLVDGLQGVEYDTIVVVGHADRIGTRTYNQRLSERRANAVKSYLVKKGLTDDRIQTEGRGEFEPATDLKQCYGMHKRQLIDCLQPDRRVEITITGQKPPQ
jgi:outer membrane protein OmpA-like peptidoglycan-associated protein